MQRKKHRKIILVTAPWAALLLLILVFRCFPPLSSFWMAHGILPISQRLHQFSSAFTFPILEIGSIAIGIIIILIIISTIKRPCKIGAFFRLVWYIAMMYVLFWYPAYWASPAENLPIPNAHQLIWLCTQLIDDLNASELSFPEPDIILEEAVSHTDNALHIKPARYPEWMDYLNIAGLYSPWTGEVIINPHMPVPALPFTAIHEVMHLNGIADEGAANIEAWRICLSAEDYFEDSARLWALKYALNLLLDAEPAAVSPLFGRMDESLRKTFHEMGGKPMSIASPVLDWLGLSDAAGNYDDLVGYLLD